jgi:hypothetical protein
MACAIEDADFEARDTADLGLWAAGFQNHRMSRTDHQNDQPDGQRADKERNHRQHEGDVGKL